MSLVFVTAAERDAYEAEELSLVRKHRSFIREKYGIYASNQGIFVTDVSDLNIWDGNDYLKQWKE
jgi:hypothetical protein